MFRKKICWKLINRSIYSVSRLDEQRHTFSHYHLDYTAIIIKTETLKNIVLEVNQSVWYKVETYSQEIEEQMQEFYKRLPEKNKRFAIGLPAF